MSRAAANDCVSRRCATPSGALEVQVRNCQAAFRLYHCADYRRIPELARFVRTCSPEELCSERSVAGKAGDLVPGCTGVTAESWSRMWSNVGACAGSTECMKQVPGEMLRTFGRMGMGVLEGAKRQLDTVYGLIFENEKTMNETKRGVYEAHRRLQCLNQQYKYKLTCELAGGIFGAATVGGAVGKAVTREAVGTVATGARPRPPPRPRSAPVVAAPARTPPSRTTPSRTTPARPAESVRPSRVAAAPTSGAAKEVAREEYLRRALTGQSTTVAQREAFAELAIKTVSDGRTVFVDFQNSFMKYLNDHLGNKNVVTAITNRRIELTFERLKALKERYPQLEELAYEDFKSGKQAFRFADGKVPPGFADDIKRIMGEAERDYVAELERLEILPEGLVPAERIFSVGIGPTGESANVAARYSARTGMKNVSITDPIVRGNLERRLGQTDVLRSGTMKIFKDSPLVERLPNGELIPSADVFEAYRKSKDAAEFGSLVRERTGVAVSAQSAQTLRQYLSMLDEWSPSLLITRPREAVTFAGSRHNGATIDISGMGALNMRELAASLVGVRDIDQAIVSARAGEQAATRTFEANKTALMDAARSSLDERGIRADIRASGDDIIVLCANKPCGDEDLAALHRAVASSSSTSNVRISAVAPGVARADQVAVRGETLEKKTRGFTLGTVPDQSRYTLMVSTGAQGTPVLRVVARTGEVAAEVERAFQEAFARALAAGE